MMINLFCFQYGLMTCPTLHCASHDIFVLFFTFPFYMHLNLSNPSRRVLNDSFQFI